MLELILGNKTAERVLLHIYHYGEIHASAISSDYKIALTPILNQLNRFEMAGILISKEIGKARLYSVAPKVFITAFSLTGENQNEIPIGADKKKSAIASI